MNPFQQALKAKKTLGRVMSAATAVPRAYDGPMRPGWDQLPPRLRARIEEVLGSRVVRTVSQTGGFSPGTADRVFTASGGAAFVKATSGEWNDRAPDIHRREAEVIAGIRSPHVPTLRGVVDADGWVALAFDLVEGSAPELPWRDEDILAALDACVALAGTACSTELGSGQDAFEAMVPWWDRVHGAGEVSPWAAERIPMLRELAASADVRGDALVQFDLRADNVLIRPDGGAVIVDWPWAVRAAPWVDPLTLLYNIRLYDPQADVGRWLAHPAFAAAEPAQLDAALAALAGFFLGLGQQPPERGVERVRAFQLDQARVVLQLLEERIG